MGLFRSKNNTISDKEMRKLQERVQTANKDSMFSKRNVARWLACNDQQKKSVWS
jgi:hypothetical protein